LDDIACRIDEQNKIDKKVVLGLSYRPKEPKIIEVVFVAEDKVDLNDNNCNWLMLA